MKFLIAGLGSVGRRHFRNLRALGEQDILLYRTRRSTLPDDELAGAPTFTDLDEALAQKPGAVIVANPTALHMEVALPAARAGCHLLLEKPVSHSLDQLDKLSAAVQRSGSRVLVGFQFRFHPTLRKAEALIREGGLGQALAARAHWGEYLPDWHPWEDYRKGYAARADLGGGAIVTLTHPLDYLRWLLGDVSAVWAFSGHVSPLEVDVEDTAEMGLQFSSGALGSAHVNFVQRPPVHRLEVVGTMGTLRWDNADGALHIQRVSGAFGAWAMEKSAPRQETIAPPPGFDRNDMFLDQMRHFIAMIKEGVAPACSLRDGVEALKLALAARFSSKEGRVVRMA